MLNVSTYNFVISISSLFSRSSSKAEEACDMYSRAANMFKMAKNWRGIFIKTASLRLELLVKHTSSISLDICFLSAAGDAFCKAAKVHLKTQSKHNAAVSFIDAGNAYKKADPEGS